MPAPALLNMFAAHTAAAGGWTPDAVSGLLGWYDSTAGVTDSAGNVTAWADQSVNARNLAWNSGYDHPVTASTTLNGDNTIYFGGTATMTATYSGSQPLTVCCLYVPTLNATCRVFDSTGRILFNATSNAGGPNKYGIYAGSVVENTSIPGGAVVHVGIFNGASSSSRINGAVDASGDPGSGGITDLYMGGYPSGDPRGFFTGSVRAWFAYDSVLSGTDLTDAEDYLNALGGGIF